MGASAGADLVAEAILIAMFVLLANTALRPLVNLINRQPLDEKTTEATYELHVSAGPEDIGRLRDLVAEHLEKHNYAIRETSTEDLSEDTVELTVVLAASTAKPGELEQVIAAVSRTSGVRHATWAMRTSD